MHKNLLIDKAPLKGLCLNLIAVLMVLLVISVACKTKDFTCSVANVHDGDTFTCSDNTKIRIWAINAPEVPPKVDVARPGGLEARDFLSSYILNKKLKCKFQDFSYKRKVAQCFINGQDIAIPLLKNKYAKELKHFSKGYYTNLLNNK